jgi:hypothetical protein
METSREYYMNHGPMTAPGANAGEVKALSKDLAAQCQVVQGVLIHRDLARWLYDLPLSDEQQNEAHVRPVSAMLARLRALDSRPMAIAREPAHRLPSVCRHFSLMLTAILREQDIAARARCGFAAYFTPGKFEDHWVCEYWNAAQGRWTLVDAQLDAVQRRALKISFNPLDVPRYQFIVAGDAWQSCRAGRADPDRFGLSHTPGLLGWWFIAGNVVRDLAALNRMEMLPWDVWGAMPRPDEQLGEKRRAFFDRPAEVTRVPDPSFAELRELYNDDGLRVPSTVFNALRNRPEAI